ncbi:hypothetical protein C4561_01630 [candidate division WWE3 bacterium]|uniref:Uncharacterized protein n=1 Tax=candidate division WWE3 bacterium TaxID=2053526 RepID=A0A3A4ZEM4_UNCKA|nr:MAG: hypothetical protein C4561_01630 [candidate division WWE3 bacterium]
MSTGGTLQNMSNYDSREAHSCLEPVAGNCEVFFCYKATSRVSRFETDGRPSGMSKTRPVQPPLRSFLSERRIEMRFTLMKAEFKKRVGICWKEIISSDDWVDIEDILNSEISESCRTALHRKEN